jgi:hypothetical protein
VPNEKITEHNLVDELRMVFPEIEASYQAELESWGGKFPGNYNVLAFVFKPFLKVELAKAASGDYLPRLCEFMECVCASGDREAINAVWLKLFKLFLPDSAVVKHLWPLLGPQTKSNLADAALRWGFVHNLPAHGYMDAATVLFTPHRRD